MKEAGEGGGCSRGVSETRPPLQEVAGRPKAHRALAGGGAIAEGHLPGENIRHATSRGSRTSV